MKNCSSSSTVFYITQFFRFSGFLFYIYIAIKIIVFLLEYILIFNLCVYTRVI